MISAAFRPGAPMCDFISITITAFLFLHNFPAADGVGFKSTCGTPSEQPTDVRPIPPGLVPPGLDAELRKIQTMNTVAQTQPKLPDDQKNAAGAHEESTPFTPSPEATPGLPPALSTPLLARISEAGSASSPGSSVEQVPPEPPSPPERPTSKRRQRARNGRGRHKERQLEILMEMPGSWGSVGHPVTCSAPCKYAKRKGGCKGGEACPYCHYCFWTKKDADVDVLAGDEDEMQFDETKVNTSSGGQAGINFPLGEAPLPAVGRVGIHSSTGSDEDLSSGGKAEAATCRNSHRYDTATRAASSSSLVNTKTSAAAGDSFMVPRLTPFGMVQEEEAPASPVPSRRSHAVPSQTDSTACTPSYWGSEEASWAESGSMARSVSPSSMRTFTSFASIPDPHGILEPCVPGRKVTRKL
ncbi:unnamed protein product [Amoebophrya sp. A120]|nr:unnamed protein product [Amoebophrya sp. A120]|eukprot:GSA120T00003397001.1